MEENSFKIYFSKRIEEDATNFWNKPVIQKAYFIGAYARAVINSSYYSEISKKNETFKRWLSNQIISASNLDRIFEMAFRFEQKLKLKIRNESEVRKLSHAVPVSSVAGFSSAKISFAFVAGYDDYSKFQQENPIHQEDNFEEK